MLTMCWALARPWGYCAEPDRRVLTLGLSFKRVLAQGSACDWVHGSTISQGGVRGDKQVRVKDNEFGLGKKLEIPVGH